MHGEHLEERGESRLGKRTHGHNRVVDLVTRVLPVALLLVQARDGCSIVSECQSV